jgi:hypothetical protein
MNATATAIRYVIRRRVDKFALQFIRNHHGRFTNAVADEQATTFDGVNQAQQMADCFGLQDGTYNIEPLTK